MVIYFLILTELMRFYVEFCVVKFSCLGKDLMEYGIRSGVGVKTGGSRVGGPELCI